MLIHRIAPRRALTLVSVLAVSLSGCTEASPTALRLDAAGAEARNPASLPDLTIVGVMAVSQTDVFAGGQVTLASWSVDNVGRAAAVHYATAVVLAADTALTSGVIARAVQPSPVALPGPIAAVVIPAYTMTIPPSTPPGYYYIGGVVDDEDRVVEQDENNNHQSVRIYVAPVLDPRNALGAGERFNCGLDEFGRAYCWGLNNFGQLGDGSTTTSNVPVAVAGDHRFVQISAEGGHACAVTASQAAYCWGRNASGQLGDGSTTDTPIPVAVTGGIAFSYVSVGNGHSCGLSTVGQVYCWGTRIQGRLGDGLLTGNATAPVPVVGGHTFKALSVGLFAACALDLNDDGWCWGNNNFRQLGSTSAAPASPVPLLVQGGHKWERLEMGAVVGCGISSAITYCWGANRFGERGNGLTFSPPSAIPTPIVGGLTFTIAMAGTGNIVFKPSCALTAAGAAYCWGPNNFGQIGSTAPTTICSFALITFTCTGTPTAVTGGLSFVAIRAGEEQVCAITTTRQFACWGRGGEGQLGNGTFATSSFTPVIVTGLQSP